MSSLRQVLYRARITAPDPALLHWRIAALAVRGSLDIR